MKYCSKCGNEVNDEAVVCVKCGCKIDNGQSNSPLLQLKTNRGLLKFILLSLITFGIYGIVVMSSVSTDINLIAGKYDGKKTMHYCLVYFIFSWLTLGIVPSPPPLSKSFLEWLAFCFSPVFIFFKYSMEYLGAYPFNLRCIVIAK